MRYFVQEILDGALHGLYRFEMGDSGLIEQQWMGRGWIRDDSAMVITHLALGGRSLEEVSRERAYELHPAAFDSPAANFVLPPKERQDFSDSKSHFEYAVHYFGSSLVGVSYGLEAFNFALAFLQAKSDQGKAKCFHWWCEQCKKSPMVRGQAPEQHFLEISIPSVLKVSAGHQVHWTWADPESDWAKSRGTTAKEEFDSLVERKSRPNWKIYINSYLV